MLRYKQITVERSSTGEHLTNALTGIGERKRIIRELRCRNVRVNAAAANAIDAVSIRAYKNQDQILDAKLDSFVTGLASGTTMLYSTAIFKLDLPLQEGDGFQVGANIGSTSDYPEITMVYEDQ